VFAAKPLNSLLDKSPVPVSTTVELCFNSHLHPLVKVGSGQLPKVELNVSHPEALHPLLSTTSNISYL